jgi:tellurite resistance protein TerC
VLTFFHLHISTGVSLAVIALVLGVTTIASLARTRREPRRRAHAGALRTKPEHVVE